MSPPAQPQRTGVEWKRLEKAITNQYWRFNTILVMLAVIILLGISLNVYVWFVQPAEKPASETSETYPDVTDMMPGSEFNESDVIDDGQSIILHRPEDIEFSDVLCFLEVREPAASFMWQQYCEETQTWEPIDAQILAAKINDTYTRTDLCVNQLSEAIYGTYRCVFTLEDGECPEPVEVHIIRPAD